MSSKKFVTVSTEYGPVKGAQIKSALGRDLFQFQTIPYMKAPLGKLRFRDAQAPEKWIEPFDATVDRPSYVSFSCLKMSIQGTEDAGIVSVATPYLDRKLPVAVCMMTQTIFVFPEKFKLKFHSRHSRRSISICLWN